MTEVTTAMGVELRGLGREEGMAERLGTEKGDR